MIRLIETENPKLKGILDKRYARARLPEGKLGELLDLVSTIGFGSDPGAARDVLGQVCEYFLGQFASAEGKKGGQFYTPASIVKTLVAVLVGLLVGGRRSNVSSSCRVSSATRRRRT